MASLQAMRESNSRIASALPAGLVAVFVGATSGIGETAMKRFTELARKPRIYFIGRRENEGGRIQSELKALHAEGEYHYLKHDVSLLRNVDDACRYLKDREKTINLLFLSCGTLISGRETNEGVYYSTALTYYSRTRFIVNLLPQLKQATLLRRVVTVAAGGKEGKVFLEDLPARNLGVLTFRGHITSMITLSLATIARQAPSVSFIHNYPGFVKTGLSRELTGIGPAISKVILGPVMAILQIPIKETGERQVYFATSARVPPRLDYERAGGVYLSKGTETAVGVDGHRGVYSIDYEAEGTTDKVQAVLKGLTEDGTAAKIWEHTESEFLRITGFRAI
jgi:NAD(P)-dependent dehydrogenase (short-subunit alcohol dehydrogenase family)